MEVDQEQAEEARLTVATYNINWGCCYGGPSEASASVAQAILNTDADIVVLQEVTEEWQSYISEHEQLGEAFPFQKFRMDDRWAGGGDATLSKIPFEEVAWVPADSGWFCGWVLRATWHIDGEESPVWVLNTHLRPPLSPTSPLYGLSVSAWFESKHDRKSDSMKFYKALLDDIESHQLPEGEEPFIIVAGDFNEEENGLAYRYFEEEAHLVDARKEFDGNSITWFWPVLGLFNYKAKYDHIFYSPKSLKCLTAKVRQEGSSDHYPVVATLAPREKEEEKEEKEKKEKKKETKAKSSRSWGS